MGKIKQICVAWKNSSSLIDRETNISFYDDIVINGLGTIVQSCTFSHRYDDFFGIRGYYTTNYIVVLRNFIKENFFEIKKVIKNNTEVLEKHPFFLINKEVPDIIREHLSNFKFISIERSYEDCMQKDNLLAIKQFFL